MKDTNCSQESERYCNQNTATMWHFVCDLWSYGRSGLQRDPLLVASPRRYMFLSPLEDRRVRELITVQPTRGEADFRQGNRSNQRLTYDMEEERLYNRKLCEDHTDHQKFNRELKTNQLISSDRSPCSRITTDSLRADVQSSWRTINQLKTKQYIKRRTLNTTNCVWLLDCTAITL